MRVTVQWKMSRNIVEHSKAESLSCFNWSSVDAMKGLFFWFHFMFNPREQTYMITFGKFL